MRRHLDFNFNLFVFIRRFCEYLLSCPSTEVRTAFLKILVFLAHASLQDGPCAPPSLNAPSKYQNVRRNMYFYSI